MNEINIKSEIGESWTEEAQYYDSYVSHGIQTKEEKVLWTEAFYSILPEEKKLCILDVGCGTGAMGLLLAEMGHSVSGIDLSEGMMSVGRKKAEDLGCDMIFELGDAENPPFEMNSFDVIINRHLLWTLPHPDTALENWYRVLKPNGTLMIIDGLWNDGSTISELRKKLSGCLTHMFEKHPHGKHGYTEEMKQILPNINGVSENDARVYLKKAGFTNITVHNLIHIRDNQRSRQKWYENLNPKGTYYLISGIKPVCDASSGEL